MRLLLLVLLISLTACGSSAPEAAVVRVGEPAPTFTVRLAQGGEASVSDDQPWTLVNFWATWCGPCIEEMPDLTAIHQTLAPQGLRVLGINTDEVNANAVQAFGDRHGADFPLAIDDSGTLELRYQAIGMPASYLLDPQGRLVQRWNGKLPAEAMAQITAHLQDAPAS
ncbi:MAG: TlpA disulfide reductase family protein [Bacteroidota bacterium]